MCKTLYDGTVHGNEGNMEDRNRQNSQEKAELEEKKDRKILDYGQVVLSNNKKHGKIHLMTIIGEIEGHEAVSEKQSKTIWLQAALSNHFG